MRPQLNTVAGVAVLDPSRIRDIAPLVLDPRGRLRVVPASVYDGTTWDERAMFGSLYGLYSFPTEELVAHLRSVIAGRRAIEIGAGHGVLAEALGIPATDNRQQEWPSVAAYYRAHGQATVPYGENVENLDAAHAIAKYRPQVVIASWVTQRYDPRLHHLGGNESGVCEEDVIAACEDYVFVGNENVHSNKTIWALPHVKRSYPWLFSRSFNRSKEFLAIWSRRE